MEEIRTQQTSGKFYKDRAIWLGSFIGGPLVAGYMLASNYKILGEKSKVLLTWTIWILVTILVFSASIMIPQIDSIPKFIIPLAYTTAAFAVFHASQNAKINKHIAAGGKFQSWWKVIGISIIGLVVTIAAVTTIIFAIQGSN